MTMGFSLAENKDFFQALGGSTRQKILSILVDEGELSVSEIVSHFSCAQPSISHHLSVLRRAGIVSFHRRGKEVLYSCNCKHLAESWEKFFSQFRIDSLEEKAHRNSLKEVTT